MARRLLERGEDVVGYDNVNSYYDTSLKEARLRILDHYGGDWTFVRADLANPVSVNLCFEKHKFTKVIHLGAQAGVRYSIANPQAYVQSNLVGFANILEACRNTETPLTYASTSSVYGNNTVPFTETDNTDKPLSLYAATKKANEVMAHAYSHLYGLPTTGLRFFTVYGPWGRPDMAPMKFIKAIEEGSPIQAYNHGHHSRDFTYIDDIVDGTLAAADSPDGYRLFNIGNSSPVTLAHFIGSLEIAVGKKAIIETADLQPGDALDTYANTTALELATHYKPRTTLQHGLAHLVDWYRAYHKDHHHGTAVAQTV